MSVSAYAVVAFVNCSSYLLILTRDRALSKTTLKLCVGGRKILYSLALMINNYEKNELKLSQILRDNLLRSSLNPYGGTSTVWLSLEGNLASS